MLFFGSSFNGMPLMSLRSAAKIGTITEPVINPHNLHIDGFYAQAMNGQRDGIVVDIDVRDLSPTGMIIDDHEDIAEQEELVRLQPIITINFKLIGKNVYAGSSKIGRVEDYVVDTKSLFIQKLYVQPSLLKLTSSQMIFDRQSIREVTDTKIVVSGPEVKDTQKVSSRFQAPSFNSASTSTISE
ncbi:MAG TPA: hypothetical protein PLJ04_00720 [Candidatus Saccharibacteria bacterium]|nr:hypothetical protein [Candidatus Saccharibacteria bacterium]HPR10082.1 hypothetical protein [Candidatus Saccharibacteria bacterium]